MNLSRAIVRVSILAVPLITGCTSAAPKTVKVVPADVPAVEPRYVEPIVLPVSTDLQIPEPVDMVGLTIEEARARVDKGEQLYGEGLPQRARAEFDVAIDLLLNAANSYPDDSRLDREMSEMVSRIHALELTALQNGSGLSDPAGEPAAIDDLRNIQTSSSPVDPKFKREVEDEIRDVTHDLPIEINDRVLRLLTYYQSGRGHSTMERGLSRAGKYRSMIETILKEEGVPLDLIYLCQAESAFVPRALSRAKAKGMWQFIPSRGKEYGLRQTWWIDERSDPEKSTRAAARHLKDLYSEFGDWYLAMAAYNAGPARVQRAMDRTGADNFWTLADKRALPRETMNYVPTILAMAIIGKNPEKYGFDVEPESSMETERVPVDKATDLRVISETLSVPLEELRQLNAHVLRWTTPPDDREFELILPKGYAAKFNEQISPLPENKRVLFQYHNVRKGETLSVIARKYRTSVSVLAQANKLSARKPLRIGQELIIPVSGIDPVRIAAVTPKVKATSYTVVRGDTLYKIASKFNVSIDELQRWNKLRSTHLVTGQKLIVTEKPVSPTPPTQKVVHEVRRGETLDQIATTYKTTVDAIISWNKTNNLTVIHPGDQITIFPGENK